MNEHKRAALNIIQNNLSGLYELEIKAKNDFFLLYGKPVLNDPFFDTRMDLFFEWFFLERKYIGNCSLVSLALKNPNNYGFKSDFSFYKQYLHELNSSFFGLFELMAPWKKHKVWFRDLIDGSEWIVHRSKPIDLVEPGQIIQTRLIPDDDLVEFGDGFIIHNIAVRDEIHFLLENNKIKNIPKPLIQGLFAKLHITSFRYSHLNPKRFYNLSDPIIKDVIQPYGL